MIEIINKKFHQLKLSAINCLLIKDCQVVSQLLLNQTMVGLSNLGTIFEQIVDSTSIATSFIVAISVIIIVIL